MPLPKEQRRGAIIILGMLGVAKPKEVLSDRVEVMLKVGLGKLGKVRRSVKEWASDTDFHRLTSPSRVTRVLPFNGSMEARRKSKVRP
jgi:hypothetical protein